MIGRQIAIKASLLLLVTTFMLHGACSRRTGNAATPFPDANEAPGWVKTGETRTFSAAELWSYIDGDADRYVKAGVESTSTSDYKFQSKLEAVADVYVMANAAGARRILDSETGGSQSLQLGDAGRLYAGSLAFCKGRYLVRLVAYQQGPEVQPALQTLGRAIESRISE